MVRIKTVKINLYQTLYFAIFHFLFFNNLLSQVSNIEYNNVNKSDLEALILISEDKLNENFFEVDSLLNIGYKWADQIEDSRSLVKLNLVKAKLHFYKHEILPGISLLQENLALIPISDINSNEIALNHLLLSDLFVVKNDFETAQKHLAKANKYLSESEVPHFTLERLNAMGFFHFHKRDYEKSKEYLEQALKIAQQEQDADKIAFQTGKLVSLMIKTGERPEALSMSLESLKLDINQLTRANAYTNIGSLYLYLQDWLTAQEYLEKSIKLKQEIGLRNGIADDLNGLGACFANLKKFEEAISVLEQSLNIKTEQNIYPGSVLGSLGNTYMEMGNVEKANYYFDEYKVQAQIHKDWEGLCGVFYNRGYYHFLNTEYDLALEQFEKCYNTGLDRVPGPFFLMINDMLSKTHEKLGNDEKSTFYRDEFEKLNEQFSEIESIKKVGAVEHNSNTESNPIESIVKLTDNSSTNSFIIKVFSLILVLISVVIFTIYYRRTTSNKKIINSPQENDKIDLYFEELFNRLDQSVDKNNRSIPPISNMAEFLKTQLSDSHGWEAFDIHFEKVHKNFYKNLISKFPQLSSNDLNMCALLKLNINNKDIAQIMAISYDSVRKSQQRLSKKMDLLEGQALRDYILKF